MAFRRQIHGDKYVFTKWNFRRVDSMPNSLFLFALRAPPCDSFVLLKGFERQGQCLILRWDLDCLLLFFRTRETRDMIQCLHQNSAQARALLSIPSTCDIPMNRRCCIFTKSLTSKELESLGKEGLTL